MFQDTNTFQTATDEPYKVFQHNSKTRNTNN